MIDSTADLPDYAERFANLRMVPLTVRFGDEKAPTEERVTFRKSGAVVHATRQGEAGAAVVTTADFDKVVAGLKDLVGGK